MCLIDATRAADPDAILFRAVWLGVVARGVREVIIKLDIYLLSFLLYFLDLDLSNPACSAPCCQASAIMFVKYLIPFVGLILPTLACEGCSHARDEDVVLTRLRPRMQPDALGAANGPKGPLAWWV